MRYRARHSNTTAARSAAASRSRRAAACRTRWSARCAAIARQRGRRRRRGTHRCRRARDARRSCTSTPTPRARQPRGCAASTRTCPPTAAVLWAQPVADDFHARFAATRAPLHVPAARRAPSGPALARAGASAGTIAPLDVDAMRARRGAPRRHARLLVVPRGGVPGEVAGEDAVARSRSRATATLVRFDFSANAFLHHMVRNIVGALVYVGAGKQPPAWIGELLAARDRTRARADVRAGRPVLHRRRLRRALRPAADAPRDRDRR